MGKTKYSLRPRSWPKLIANRLTKNLSALETEAFFRDRATDGSRDAFLAFLDGAGDEKPTAGDSPTEPSR
ncbi:hypothetical protein [Nitrospirillum bahiense]|uniref:hypothetical protein n=1 Tax=Nitrospirillum amazonense TaxID=28077 RepID=UPI0011A2180B|nr:hypothetical protein [Nitrospirillum amazonense]